MREIGLRGPLADRLNDRGCILYYLGELSEALAVLEKAYELGRELGGRGISAYLMTQALIFGDLREIDKAMTSLDIAEQIIRKEGDKESLGICLVTRGRTLDIHGKLVEAMACYKKGERQLREIGNKRDVAITLCNQGEILIKSGKRYGG